MQSSLPHGRAHAGAILLTSTLLLAACSGGTPSTSAPSASAPASNPSAPSAASVAPSVAPSAALTPVPSDGQTAGQVRTDPFRIDQVWVPAGTFTMGTDAEAIATLTAADPPPWV